MTNTVVVYKRSALTIESGDVLSTHKTYRNVRVNFNSNDHTFSLMKKTGEGSTEVVAMYPFADFSFEFFVEEPSEA